MSTIDAKKEAKRLLKAEKEAARHSAARNQISKPTNAIFNGDFDMFYSLPNGSGTLREVTTTIDVYVYNMLKKGNLRNSFGYAGAGAFFQSVVGFVLILVTNRIVKKHQPEMALF